MAFPVPPRRGETRRFITLLATFALTNTLIAWWTGGGVLGFPGYAVSATVGAAIGAIMVHSFNEWRRERRRRRGLWVQ